MNLAVSTPTSMPLAPWLKALGDDLRLAILQVLAKDSLGVLELTLAFGVKQPAMSHHLKILAGVGLVDTRREGNSIFYRRTQNNSQDPLFYLKKAFFEALDALPWQAPAPGLEQVWQARAQASRQFFEENAHKFKAQQELIAEFDVYNPQVAQLLDKIPLNAHDLALEVGPGTGDFLPILASRFKQVIALDTHPKMLAECSRLIQQKQLQNVRVHQGDTSALMHLKLVYHCVVMNMVLHHTASPAQLFMDIAPWLANGGIFMVTELCLHHQNWVREACGDVWLGFDPDDLTAWAEAAGLTVGPNLFIALRNGFQIQVRQFIKP